MIQAFLFLPSHFLMHLLSSLHLLIEQFFLLLLLCFLLLVPNKIFDHVGLCHMLITLLIKHLFLLHLFFLCIVDILLYLLAMGSLIVKDFLSLLLFLSFVQKSNLSFFINFHLLSERLLVVVLHISATLVHNITCFLSSLFYLLEGTRFFGFKELNSIRKKTEIILCTFSGKFGSNKFLV